MAGCNTATKIRSISIRIVDPPIVLLVRVTGQYRVIDATSVTRYVAIAPGFAPSMFTVPRIVDAATAPPSAPAAEAFDLIHRVRAWL